MYWALPQALWSGVAMLGLHLIIEKMAWLHTLIMDGGGLYLCWMGYQMLCSALKKSPSLVTIPQAELTQGGSSFVKGLLTNLANPKAIIYFGSVFSLFVGDNSRAAQRWAIFFMIVLETLVWFLVVASTLFAGFGIHLIFSR